MGSPNAPLDLTLSDPERSKLRFAKILEALYLVKEPS